MHKFYMLTSVKVMLKSYLTKICNSKLCIKFMYISCGISEIEI
jgi:hypothetical protein